MELLGAYGSHIILDGYSVKLFLRELFCRIKEQNFVKNNRQIQYKQAVAWISDTSGTLLYQVEAEYALTILKQLSKPFYVSNGGLVLRGNIIHIERFSLQKINIFQTHGQNNISVAALINAIYCITLGYIFNKEKLFVLTPCNGRMAVAFDEIYGFLGYRQRMGQN